MEIYSIDKLSDIASISSAVIAFLAMIIAFFAYRSTRREAKLTLAKSLYKDYLNLAFENPKLSLASYPVENPRYYSFEKEDVKLEEYEYYVAQLVLASEEILDLTSNDLYWRNTLRDQLKQHALYLDSERFPENHSNRKFGSLVIDAIEAYKDELDS
ncbi:hypothetical protein [Photobacterium sp. GB-3]|uniref:hypothetical protein n=1 Tax=Photobacterium sp. GB-3 TaxID=2022110 RepID=UPI000D1789A6|nr:hypothetical protein [Photobacterium sp. GB-3]PSV55693.1 hypothetical protein C9J43_14595 [Photobacterium sp. GB-3]